MPSTRSASRWRSSSSSSESDSLATYGLPSLRARQAIAVRCLCTICVAAYPPTLRAKRTDPWLPSRGHDETLPTVTPVLRPGFRVDELFAFLEPEAGRR